MVVVEKKNEKGFDGVLGVREECSRVGNARVGVLGFRPGGQEKAVVKAMGPDEKLVGDEGLVGGRV